MQAKAGFTLFLLSVSLQAQTTLHGRVLDPSGATVPKATVTLQSRDGNLRRTAITNQQGEYTFDRIAPAEFVAIAQAEGFSPSAPANPSTQPDLKLELIRLSNQLNVTASATTLSTDETAKAFDLIDSAELNHRNVFSVVEALRLTPGVRIMQLGGPGSLARIHTRGLRAFDTSLLIDGFRFRDSSAPQGDATGFLADLLVVDSERIEVLRGSGASLYGTNAMGGVVNLVTDQGGSPFHGDLTLEGGGLGLFRGATKLSGGALHDRLRYTAGFAHLNVTRGLDGDDRNRNSTAQGHVSYAIAPRTLISARIFANNTFLGLNGSPYAGIPGPAIPAPAIEGVTFFTSFNDPDARRSSNFVSGLFTLTHQISSTASIRAAYQGLTTSRDNRNGPAGAQFQPRFNTSSVYDSRIDTAQARTDLILARRHFIAAGYEFERETYDNLSTDPTASARVRVNQQSHAVYAQDQWKLFEDRFQIALSGRIQNFRLSALPQFEGGAGKYQGITLANPPTAYTGDAALFYFLPKTGAKLRAHLGNAYRAPTLYERFGTGYFLGTFTPYGDPLIAPERALAFDAGFDQYLANSRLRLSGTYFYTRLQQVVGFDFSGIINRGTDPYGRSSGYRDTGGGLSRGAELSLHAQATRRLYFQTSYTYTNADERFSTLLGGSLRSIRVSDHMFTAMATHRLWRTLDATVTFFGASNYLWQMFAGGNRPYLFPGPKKADLSLQYTLRKLQFYVRVENLFNHTYYEDGFRTPKAWAVGGFKFLF